MVSTVVQNLISKNPQTTITKTNKEKQNKNQTNQNPNQTEQKAKQPKKRSAEVLEKRNLKK